MAPRPRRQGASLRSLVRGRCVAAQAPARVRRWPVVAAFGFLAHPDEPFFLKPTGTRRAAEADGYPYAYEHRPSWIGYAKVLELYAAVKRNLPHLRRAISSTFSRLSGCRARTSTPTRDAGR